MYNVTPTSNIFKDVLPGEPWQPEPAARYNAVNELLRQENNINSAHLTAVAGNQCCINVFNTSNRLLDFRKAVQIDTDFAGPENLINLSDPYVCGKPVEDEECFWGIALENIPPGKAGMVQIAGVFSLPEVWGARSYQLSYNGNPEPFYQNYINPRKDGAFELNNRGRARVLWWQTTRKENQGNTPKAGRAVVLLNTPDSYIYDGMFAVKDKGNGNLFVKGGLTDLVLGQFADKVATLEDSEVSINPHNDPMYVHLVATKGNGGIYDWTLKAVNSVTANGMEMYQPGQTMVWPLARYNSATYYNDHYSPVTLIQLQYGPVNFRERYYLEQ